ncbi:MAG: dTMP kinase [Candidatus Woesearchaeota archaeon]
MKGLYVVIESVDGGGKGTILKGFRKYHEEKGDVVYSLDRSIEDLNDSEDILSIYGTEDRIPRYHVLKEFLAKKGVFPSVFLVGEPTYSELGKFIREVLINKKTYSNYSSMTRVHAYAEDRHNLLERFILPALEDGKNVYCTRNVTSSLVYQSTELNCSFDKIGGIHGNAFALNNLPKFTIVSALDIKKVLANLSRRDEKQDDAFFENSDFQSVILPKYLGSELKEYLESKGTKMLYFNIPTDSTPEDTINKSKELLKDLLSQRKLADFK